MSGHFPEPQMGHYSRCTQGTQDLGHDTIIGIDTSNSGTSKLVLKPMVASSSGITRTDTSRIGNEQ